MLRPLSAHVLEPTLPEELGIVDRTRLLAITGRSRQEQFALAAERGVTQFSTPAGGCQLTDRVFAQKVKDLFAHEERPTTKDMELLTIGRHFRVGAATKVILGRNELENLLLEGHADTGYTCVRPKFAGPAAMISGQDTGEARSVAVELIRKHTKPEKLPGGTLEFWVTPPPAACAEGAAAVAAGPSGRATGGGVNGTISTVTWTVAQNALPAGILNAVKI
ncbi:MAG: hypothetical protein Q8S13_04720 [Dehalococcoidia bacterium]|nr:hypothetical protein [Dehalococcoidia bacterium]